jgi:glycosyltransferase involved in cell wall biosynthesis
MTTRRGGADPGRPPRVLRIITRMNVGGPATHVTIAENGLRARGWNSLLVHGTVESHEVEADLTSLPEAYRRRVPEMARAVRPGPDARAFARILSIARTYRPDLIHTHMSKAGVLGRLTGMLGRPGAARVHTFHGTVFGGYFGERSSSGIVRTERFLGHRTDRVVALSERQRDELLANRIAPAERIAVVPLGLQLDRFADRDRTAARDRLAIGPEELVVLAVGRLVPIKRVDRLLRAFAAIAADVPTARLYLVGDGPERDALLAEASALGITDRLRHVGWTSDTPIWYAACDVVALTSESEGTPLALIEAAAAGRSVVATDVGGVADVVIDGQTGFVVPRNDEHALAMRLRELLLDADLRGRMGAAAGPRSVAFAADRLVDDLDALYRAVLGRGPAPAMAPAGENAFS